MPVAGSIPESVALVPDVSVDAADDAALWERQYRIPSKPALPPTANRTTFFLLLIFGLGLLPNEDGVLISNTTPHPHLNSRSRYRRRVLVPDRPVVPAG